MSSSQFSSPIDTALPLVPNTTNPELYDELTRVYAAIRRIQLGASFNTIASNIVASGANQATAFQLTAGINAIGTTSAGTGVILPTIGAGSAIAIKNFGVNAVNIYPTTGGRIDSLAINAPFVLAAGASKTFQFISDTNSFSV